MKYSNRKKEFIKLTIRVESEELANFKKVCEIMGLSANNEINILIRQFLYENSRFFDNKNCQLQFDLQEKVAPKD